MDSPLEVLAVLLGIFLIVVVPIFSIIAFSRTLKPGKQRGTDPALLKHIEELTQRVSSLEGRARTPTEAISAPSVPSSVQAAPSPVEATKPAAPMQQPTAPVVQQSPMQATPPPPRPVVEASRAAQSVGSNAQIWAAPKEPRKEFESVVGGRWLNYAGIVALLFGVAFFIKYAFDNHWVGPTGRIAIGLFIGAGLVVWSQFLLKRGYKFFSEGMAGLGAAVLYVSLWAGWHYYQLFSQAAAFGFMVIVTATMMIVAVGRDSQRIAILAVAGGLVTPILLTTGRDQELILFTYLMVIGAGVIAICWKKGWRIPGPVQFVMTVAYFWGWYATFYQPDRIVLTIGFSTVFFILFAMVPVVRSARTGDLYGEEYALILANAFSYIASLHEILWPEKRWTLAVAVLALAMAHLLLVRALPRKSGDRAGQAVRALFAGMALVFATLVIPIRLDGKWITMAFAVEGLLLIWSGLRDKLWGLRTAGLALFGIVGVRMMAFPEPAPQAFWNARFATFAVTVACFGIAAILADRESGVLIENEKGVYIALAIVANVVGLIALSLETWDWFGQTDIVPMDRWHAQQLALSILWTAFAIGLLLSGIVRKSAMLRWEALALLGVVVGKVFLLDLSSLDKVYRIVSFVVLGVVLLRVSFYYQKKLRTRAGAEK
jgi:uncharacterized membrane protein